MTDAGRGDAGRFRSTAWSRRRAPAAPTLDRQVGKDGLTLRHVDGPQGVRVGIPTTASCGRCWTWSHRSPSAVTRAHLAASRSRLSPVGRRGTLRRVAQRVEVGDRLIARVVTSKPGLPANHDQGRNPARSAHPTTIGQTDPISEQRHHSGAIGDRQPLGPRSSLTWIVSPWPNEDPRPTSFAQSGGLSVDQHRHNHVRRERFGLNIRYSSSPQTSKQTCSRSS